MIKLLLSLGLKIQRSQNYGPGPWNVAINCLPFGLLNSAGTMQRLMEMIFNADDCRVFVYLDDLIIATKTFK